MHTKTGIIKTNMNQGVHHLKLSSSWAARFYAQIIKTKKNWGVHLLMLLSSWAICSYSRSRRPTRIMSLVHEAPSRLFRALFHWDPPQNSSRTWCWSMQSQMDYSTKSAREEADAIIPRPRKSLRWRNSKMQWMLRPTERCSLYWARWSCECQCSHAALLGSSWHTPNK